MSWADAADDEDDGVIASSKLQETFKSNSQPNPSSTTADLYQEIQQLKQQLKASLKTSNPNQSTNEHQQIRDQKIRNKIQLTQKAISLAEAQEQTKPSQKRRERRRSAGKSPTMSTAKKHVAESKQAPPAAPVPTPTPVPTTELSKLNVNEIRIKFTAFAKDICTDAKIINQAVNDTMNFKGGEFAKSLTQTSMNVMGKKVIKKFVDKAIKKQQKNQKNQKNQTIQNKTTTTPAVSLPTPTPTKNKTKPTPTPTKRASNQKSKTTSSTPGKLQVNETRAQLTIYAKEICTDANHVKQIVNDIMNFSNGEFAKSFTSKVMEQMGKSTVQKFVKKAKKRQLKKEQKKITPSVVVESSVSTSIQKTTPITTTPGGTDIVNTKRSQLEQIARSRISTQDEDAVRNVVDHIMTEDGGVFVNSLTLKSFEMKLYVTEIVRRMQPVLDAHNNATKRDQASRKALEDAAKERAEADQLGAIQKQDSSQQQKALQEVAAEETTRQEQQNQQQQQLQQQQQQQQANDKEGQARLFARVQADTNKKVNATKLPATPAKLDLVTLRARFTALAQNLSQDSNIIQNSVDAALNFKDGEFAKSCTEATFNQFGSDLIKKFVKKAKKKQQKLSSSSTNVNSETQLKCPSCNFTNQSNTKCCVSCASVIIVPPQTIPESKTNSMPTPPALAPWELAAKEEDKRDMAIKENSVNRLSENAIEENNEFEAAQQEFMDDEQDDEYWYPPEEEEVGDVWYPPQQQNNSQPNSQQYPPVIDLQEKQKEIQQDIQLQNQQIQQMQQKQQMEPIQTMQRQVDHPKVDRPNETIKVCQFHAKRRGSCRNGNQCKFVHSNVCIHWIKSNCRFSSMECRDIHPIGDSNSRNWYIPNPNYQQGQQQQQQQQQPMETKEPQPQHQSQTNNVVTTIAASTLVPSAPSAPSAPVAPSATVALVAPAKPTTSNTTNTPSNMEYASVSWLRAKLVIGHITEDCFDDIASTFHEHKIRTMFQVKMLNQDFLAAMGIVALGHQMVLLAAIDEYKIEEQQNLMVKNQFLFDHDEDDGFSEQ